MGSRFRYVQHNHHEHIVLHLPSEDCHTLVCSGRFAALTRREGRAKLRISHQRSSVRRWRAIGIGCSVVGMVIAVGVWLRLVQFI